MALACEGMSFLKATIEVLPGKQPVSPPLAVQSEEVSESCWVLTTSPSMLAIYPCWESSVQTEEAGPEASGQVVDSKAGKERGADSWGTNAEPWEAGGLVHPRLKSVQLCSQESVSRAQAKSKGSAMDTERAKRHYPEGSLCGSDCSSPLSVQYDGSYFESCAGSPFGSTVSSSTWRPSAEGTVTSLSSLSSPHSECGSLSSGERRIESLEVQLAAKSSEIQRLADVCSGAEWALSEREKETEHLGALSQNLEEQIVAKDEVLVLSQELIWGLEKRLVALEMERDAFVVRGAEYEQAVLTLQVELDRVREELATLRREKGDLAETIEGWEGLLSSAEQELKEQGNAKAALEARVKKMETEAAEKSEDLTRKVKSMQRKLAETVEALRASAEVIGELKRLLREKEDCLTESGAVYESAMQAQTALLRGAEKRQEGLERDAVRKDGNLEAVGVLVADLQRQLEATEGECTQARACVTRLHGEVEASRTGARLEKERLEAMVKAERGGRMMVEAQLEAREVELRQKTELVAQLKEEVAGRFPLSRLAPLPLTESLASSAWRVSESAASFVGVLDMEASGSSAGSGQGDQSDAESVAENPRGTRAVERAGKAGAHGHLKGAVSRGSGAARPIAACTGVTSASDMEGKLQEQRSPGAKSTSKGLLGQLWTIVSCRCTREVEVKAPSSLGLRLLLSD